MAFESRLRLIALRKQALVVEAQVLRSTADLELLGWNRRLGVLGSIVKVVVPLLAAWRLLRR